MKKVKSKIDISFYVEGQVEQWLINFINEEFSFHKICNIKNPEVTKYKKNIEYIIQKVYKLEKFNENKHLKPIVILIYDNEVKVSKIYKNIHHIHINKPSIDYPIALSLGIKANKNDQVRKIKSKIKIKYKTTKQNYLREKRLKDDINYNILFNHLGKLGLFFKHLINILNKNKNANQSKVNETIKKIALKVFK